MKTHRRLLVTALAALAPLALPAVAHAQELQGTVGPGFTITLSQAGAAVTHLDRGTYTLTVDDRSEFHNFHLTGPGNVNVSTDVEFVGTRTFTVTLVDGVYTFLCDPHSTTMIGRFAVGTATLPTPRPPTSTTTSARRLTATVGPGFTISLKTRTGAAVRSVKAGTYTIVVRDRSTIHNFHLSGLGVNKKTGVTFRGTVTWRVTFRKGKTYRFVCDPHRAQMKGSFRTT